MTAELGSPYLPLRLVEEHLSSIEVLWLRRDHEACMMLPSSVSAEAWSTKLEAHIAALGWRKEEAIREASLRLTSPLYSEVFAAAYCLMRLSPERCVARDGRVLLRSPRASALCDAIAEVRPAAFPYPGDDLGIEALSAVQDVPEGVLLASLASMSPRGGLLAAARRSRIPPFAAGIVARLAVGDAGERLLAFRPLALFAWGLWRARESRGPDPAFAALIDLVLGDRMFDMVSGGRESCVDSFATLHVLSLLGHASTSRRIARRIIEGGPDLDLVFALGLLGIPRDAGVLIEVLRSDDASLRREALRSLAMVTGRWFVIGGLPDGKRELGDEAADVDAAHLFLEGWSERGSAERFHLGRPLAKKAEGAAPSFQFLQRLLMGESTRALPGLLDGRPRRAWHQLTLSLPAPMLETRRLPQERLSFSHMPKDAFHSRSDTNGEGT